MGASNIFRRVVKYANVCIYNIIINTPACATVDRKRGIIMDYMNRAQFLWWFNARNKTIFQQADIVFNEPD